MKLLLLNLYDNKKRDAKLKLGINRFDNKNSFDNVCDNDIIGCADYTNHVCK